MGISVIPNWIFHWEILIKILQDLVKRIYKSHAHLKSDYGFVTPMVFLISREHSQLNIKLATPIRLRPLLCEATSVCRGNRISVTSSKYFSMH